MVKVDIRNNGVINVVHPEQAERVRMYLKVNPEPPHIQVQLTPKPNYTYSNRLWSRLPLKMEHVQSIIPGFLLEPLYLDEARTTAPYAHHYNKVVKHMLPNAHPIYSYNDGYNFLGDAFINFALSIALFEQHPTHDTNSLYQLLNLYRNNKYLSTLCLSTGWSRYLTESIIDTKHLAGSFKGLIGSVYKANGPECIPALLQYVNKTLIKDTPIHFNKNKNWLTHILVATTGFVVGAFCTLTVIHIGA